MSEHLPFHIQEEILKRLPVKSLIQLRSVSKAWKFLIDSSEFIRAQSIRRHTQPQHLLLWYGIGDSIYGNYVCFVDDDTFPQHSYVPALPQSVKQLCIPAVIGSSHGLVCFYGSDPTYTTKMAVIWNPSIRKSMVVSVPGNLFVGFPSAGFGVCPVTGDGKIVSIRQSRNFKHCKVMVYRMSSGKWNPSSNLPTILIRDPWSRVVTDMFVYWTAGPGSDKIISFDVTNEYFEAIDLPDCVGFNPTMRCIISKLHESLAMIRSGENNCCVVWKMDDGVQRFFTKLFTIHAPDHYILGFRKSGIPIVVGTVDANVSKFVVYEPNSEHDSVLEITRPASWFHMSSYVETLLFR